ncbi:MAG: glycerol-3-phosphate dehydrogenase [Chlamydiota bacterium]|jgi:glycerol-3-phosphate dehydrogenase (NAD(P)+)
MKIGYLGAGTWGFALADLLSKKGHDVTLWTARKELALELTKKRMHPKLPKIGADARLKFTSDLNEVIAGAEILIESVTSKGIRPVFEQLLSIQSIDVPIIVTSKGIEQHTGLLLPEVLVELLGEKKKHLVGCLSGPSHAEEVIQSMPTALVAASYDPSLMHQIVDLFTTSFLRVYPNSDIHGVAFGGAVKNIIAIACGISDGLGFGVNTKAALMTRGLHEIRKLSAVKGCNKETLNGLAGMGDLCVTCLSTLSRNYTFGRKIAEGLKPSEAQQAIGMVVEGAYTCVSALELAQKYRVSVPITEAVFEILYNNADPKTAVKELLKRAIKEEHL